MNEMTIGIVFNVDKDRVILLLKDHPEWQNGKYNFPGGHYKEGETPEECISREFLEETGIKITPPHWINIGKLQGEIEGEDWRVDILAAFKSDEFKPIAPKGSREMPSWYSVKDLPEECIDNVPWLVAWATDATVDGPYYSTFEYR